MAQLIVTGKPGSLQVRLYDPATLGKRADIGGCVGDYSAARGIFGLFGRRVVTLNFAMEGVFTLANRIGDVFQHVKTALRLDLELLFFSDTYMAIDYI